MYRTLHRSDKHVVLSCYRAQYVLLCYDTSNSAQYH